MVNKILLKVSLFQYALYKVLQLKHITSSKGLRRKLPARVSRNHVTYGETDAAVETGKWLSFVSSIIMENVANWCCLTVPWQWTPSSKLQMILLGALGGLSTVTVGSAAVARGFQGEGSYHLHLHQPGGLPQGKDQKGAKGPGKEGSLSGTSGNGWLPCIPQTVFSYHALSP